MPDTFQPSAADMAYAARYLQAFGYAEPPPAGPAMAPRAPAAPPTDALALFQDFAGLPQTRELDAATLDKMKQPRCGVPDISRSAAELARWRKNRLTYFVEKYVNGIAVVDQQAALRAAWDDWQKACDIKLTQTQDANADIVISIGKGRPDNFDGPGSTLAWAFLPNGSDRQLLMRFDVDEAWTISGGGIRLRNVACHEFGHLLGLEHSRVQTALMAPFYSAAVVSPQANDDVSRIKALYGPPVGGDTPPPPPPGPPGNDPCKTVNDCLRTLSNSLSSIRHGRAFTVATTTVSEEFSQLIQRVGELPCDKIGPLITAIAAALAACQPQPVMQLGLPCAGGLPCATPAAASPCAGITGLLALCAQLGPILKACVPTAATVAPGTQQPV